MAKTPLSLSASKPKGLEIGSCAGRGSERQRLLLFFKQKETKEEDKEEELGSWWKTNHLHTLTSPSPRKLGLDQACCLGTRSLLLIDQLTSVSQHLLLRTGAYFSLTRQGDQEERRGFSSSHGHTPTWRGWWAQAWLSPGVARFTNTYVCMHIHALGRTLLSEDNS